MPLSSSLFLLLAAADTAALPPLPTDWEQLPYVTTLKNPRLKDIADVDNYIDGDCKITYAGATQTVMVHLAFLVDATGKILKIEARDDGCTDLEKRVQMDARTSFKGVIAPDASGETRWFRTEIAQNWR